MALSAVFGGSTGRSMGGDGDECLTWCAGDVRVERHDGRTGLPMIPSIEVLERLGELSTVSTTNMAREFDALWWWRYQREKEMVDGTLSSSSSSSLFISPDKDEIASEEWQQLRASLYL